MNYKMEDEFDGWPDLDDNNSVEPSTERPIQPAVSVGNEGVVPSQVVSDNAHVKVEKPVEKKPESPTVHTVSKKVPMGLNVKILCYGGAGGGKTRAALMYFKKMWEQDNDVRLKYIDTDRGLTETLKELDKDGNRVFSDELIDHIDYFDCMNYENIISALKEIFTNTRKKDLIIFDMIDELYDLSQEEYTMKIFGDNLAQFYMQRRREMEEKGSKKQNVFDGWKDWVGIKLLHNREVINKVTKYVGCHVICITSAKEVDMHEYKDGKLVKIVKNPTIFTKVGFAPIGEKRNDHRFDRIYYFSIGVDGWYYMAVKKRGGEIYKKIPVGKGDYPEL